MDDLMETGMTMMRLASVLNQIISTHVFKDGDRAPGLSFPAWRNNFMCCRLLLIFMEVLSLVPTVFINLINFILNFILNFFYNYHSLTINSRTNTPRGTGFQFGDVIWPWRRRGFLWWRHRDVVVILGRVLWGRWFRVLPARVATCTWLWGQNVCLGLEVSDVMVIRHYVTTGVRFIGDVRRSRPGTTYLWAIGFLNKAVQSSFLKSIYKQPA